MSPSAADGPHCCHSPNFPLKRYCIQIKRGLQPCPMVVRAFLMCFITEHSLDTSPVDTYCPRGQLFKEQYTVLVFPHLWLCVESIQLQLIYFWHLLNLAFLFTYRYCIHIGKCPPPRRSRSSCLITQLLVQPVFMEVSCPSVSSQGDNSKEDNKSLLVVMESTVQSARPIEKPQ